MSALFAFAALMCAAASLWVMLFAMGRAINESAPLRRWRARRAFIRDVMAVAYRDSKIKAPVISVSLSATGAVIYFDESKGSIEHSVDPDGIIRVHGYTVKELHEITSRPHEFIEA